MLLVNETVYYYHYYYCCYHHHYLNFFGVIHVIIIVSSVVRIYMLFAGWEVRMVKNCDRGLENAALGLRPRAVFFHHTDRPLAGK